MATSTVRPMDIFPWDRHYAQLAQRFSTLYLRLIRIEGARYYVTAVDPASSVRGTYGVVVKARIERGILSLDSAPDEYFLWDCKEHALRRNLGKHFDWLPVDGVPHEIHAIEDPDVREIARDAYIQELWP